MRQKHRNQIAAVLKEVCDSHYLNFNNFSSSFTRYENHYTIRYKGSAYFFEVRSSSYNHVIGFYPGKDSIRDNKSVDDFEATFNYIKDWIPALIEEKNEPDLWEEFSKQQDTYILEATDNEPLAQEEQDKAVQILEDIQARIFELESSNEEATDNLAERLAEVEAELSLLKEAVADTKKGVFVRAIGGAIANLILRQVISPENVSDVWKFVMDKIPLLSNIKIPGLTN